MRHMCRRLAAVCLALLVVEPSHATVPVIDVAALAQLFQEILYWRQQLQGMADQISALRNQLAIATGNRGLQGLMPQTVAERNYLPSSIGALAAVANGGAGISPELGADFRGALVQTSMLTPAQLAEFSAVEQAGVADTRAAIAERTALLESGILRSGQRFAALQSLIDAISIATDPKSVGELQARIAAEQAMVANEQVKLAALNAWAESQAMRAQWRRQEAAIAAHGTFAARFAPVAP
jgi:type IV secretion system protein VirB5